MGARTPEERSSRGRPPTIRSRYTTATRVGELGDHGEIVALVNEPLAVRRHSLAHRGRARVPGGHAETGRRLVEDDHLRPIGERHRERPRRRCPPES